MTYELLDLKRALKRQGLHLINNAIDGTFGNLLHLFDGDRGIHTTGKTVDSFTEDGVYHWPLLSHDNLAPLINVVYIHSTLSIFLTIDRRVTLKDIIHEDDFVHDPKCFERKKVYAKGIFSGLSYLHEKSLCLMNLSDSNVVIRQIDQPVISDFSCLVSPGSTTKPTLSVPELYRAPETYTDDFEAKAAEIWASGVLMLDMFLAHTVPWAIVDFKPSKVVRLVDKLPFEVLQAVNIGSVIATASFEKYKTFQKCFFRENPAARVSARNASIASFLSPIFDLKERRRIQQITANAVKNDYGDTNKTHSCTKVEGPELMSECMDETGPHSIGKASKLSKRQ